MNRWRTVILDLRWTTWKKQPYVIYQTFWGLKYRRNLHSGKSLVFSVVELSVPERISGRWNRFFPVSSLKVMIKRALNFQLVWGFCVMNTNTLVQVHYPSCVRSGLLVSSHSITKMVTIDNKSSRWEWRHVNFRLKSVFQK